MSAELALADPAPHGLGPLESGPARPPRHGDRARRAVRPRVHGSHERDAGPPAGRALHAEPLDVSGAGNEPRRHGGSGRQPGRARGTGARRRERPLRPPLRGDRPARRRRGRGDADALGGAGRSRRGEARARLRAGGRGPRRARRDLDRRDEPRPGGGGRSPPAWSGRRRGRGVLVCRRAPSRRTPGSSTSSWPAPRSAWAARPVSPPSPTRRRPPPGWPGAGARFARTTSI